MRATCKGVFLVLASQLTAAAHAVTYFPSNATITTPIIGTAEVGRDANGANTSPTVTLDPTGSISADLVLHNSSMFDSSGLIGNDVLLFDSSQFTSRSTTTPPIGGRFFVRGQSNATVQSSIAGNVFVEQSGTFLLGQNGNIGGNLLVSGNGKATITSGRVRGTITGNVNQTAPVIDIAGGIIEEGVATVAVAPGVFSGEGGPTPQVIFRGNNDLFFETETMNGTDPAYPGRSMQLHYVSGTLQDGTVLRFLPVKIENGTGAQIVILPEPVTLTALAGASAAMLRRRRR